MTMAEYKTVDSLIAEISSSNFFKDNPQLIDKSSIYRWVNLALKKFGSNVLHTKGRVYKIENYRGILDNDFSSLSLAVLCEPSHYYAGNTKKTIILDSLVYKDKIEDCFTRTYEKKRG